MCKRSITSFQISLRRPLPNAYGTTHCTCFFAYIDNNVMLLVLLLLPFILCFLYSLCNAYRNISPMYCTTVTWYCWQSTANWEVLNLLRKRRRAVGTPVFGLFYKFLVNVRRQSVNGCVIALQDYRLTCYECCSSSACIKWPRQNTHPTVWYMGKHIYTVKQSSSCVNALRVTRCVSWHLRHENR